MFDPAQDVFAELNRIGWVLRSSSWGDELVEASPDTKVTFKFSGNQVMSLAECNPIW